jgi:hypothetical protein
MADPTNPVSPKVKSSTITSIITGLVLTAIVAGIGAATPDLFSFLGAWQGVAYTAIVAVGVALSGYLTKDPDRIAGQEAKAAIEAQNYGAPALSFPAEEVDAPASTGTFGDPSATAPKAEPAVSDKPVETVIQK